MISELESLSRSDLIQRVIELQNELHTVRGGSEPIATPPARRHNERYDISMSVLVVTTNQTTGERQTKSVPLQAILSKSYTREDLRDADTPVYGGYHYDRGSVDLARFSGGYSEYSIGSEGSFDSPDAAPRPSVSSMGSPQLSTTGDAKKPPRVAPLQMPRNLSLDPDAIMTHQTLTEFNRMYGTAGGAQTPISSPALGVAKYVVESFVRKNSFRHNQWELEGFGRALISLCGEVENLIRCEPRHVSLQSPTYVFGDIHGNFRDLIYFMDNLIQFQDLRYTPHSFMFLGDYVDRGEFSVEVIAYLFALKVLAPNKIMLLRGNHEDTLVNGDINSYGSTSFRSQCHQLFSPILGQELWSRASVVFAQMPLTGNIDNKIFCTHGGIPRYNGGPDRRLEVLMDRNFPALQSLFEVPLNETPQQNMYRQTAIDVCWSDPAEDESNLNKYGFGTNPRGNGVYMFGTRAVDEFLEKYGYEFIFRAHQEKSDGLKVSKNARVFTIFSTSAYVGHQNGAGVVLVAEGKLRMIIKSPDEDEEDT